MKHILGLHAVEIWLQKAPKDSILYLAKENKRNTMLKELALKRGIRVRHVENAEITRRCGEDEHKGILLTLPSGKPMSENDLNDYLPSLGGSALILALDGITDPRNLGAILRNAEQFSADAVVIPKRGGAGDSPVVSKTSAGADAIVPLVSVVNVSRTVELLKKNGFWVYGTDMNGIPLYSAKLTGKVALVVGSEERGLGVNIKNHCDEIISIPTTGLLDSLNVSVATGIFLYEIRRQQSD